MSVARQIVKDVLGSAEGRLGIDDPFLPEQRAQESGEVFFFTELQALTKEVQPMVPVARRNPAMNLPRKTRLRTLTGSRKQ
jgi:hypothetical protein